MMTRTVLAFLVVFGLASLAQADQGNPNLKSIDAIAFGPNGLLIIGSGTQVVTVDADDMKATNWTKNEVANITEVLAGKLGLSTKDIEVRRLTVNPASRKAYVAVRNLKVKQDIILTVDGAGSVAEFSLENVKFTRYPLAVGTSAVTRLTDVTWAGGKIVAATQAGDTFGSRVFAITPAAKDAKAVSFSTETYHVGHGKWETKAPIICIMPYEEDGQAGVVGSFTCTPIVRYPLQDVESKNKVKGVSVVELGTGNTPRSMFAYDKNGKRYILVNAARNNKKTAFGTSGYWAAKVDFDLLKETTNVNEKALWRVKGGTFQPATDRVSVATEFYGVHYMAKLDDTRALVIRDDKGAMNLRVLALP
ncbi:MAG: hypothetical protein HYR84_02275 [Planctomycetes bacterium]|nr:hypothetical protein [Planctomycetota bacterium]